MLLRATIAVVLGFWATSTAVNAQRADSRPNEKPVPLGELPIKAARLYAETFSFPQRTR